MNLNPSPREVKPQKIVDLLAKRDDQPWLHNFDFAVKVPSMCGDILGVRITDPTTSLDNVCDMTSGDTEFFEKRIEDRLARPAEVAARRWTLRHEHDRRCPHEALHFSSSWKEPSCGQP
jgi:hypothetical protein